MDDYSDGGWEAFEAEFVTYTDRAASGIDFVPADRAPKFLQDLDDLEVWVGR
jgi:hypothetical protein